ncbi:hypothetical protein [Actinopolyspora halophila]|uniref:hypothetical protein n=1 Tax=Actinopolyspora halophila TaxID=1850 RepID=UPI000376404C|nr:hypothetical protein [Actinopolyspora halophila]
METHPSVRVWQEDPASPPISRAGVVRVVSGPRDHRNALESWEQDEPNVVRGYD